MAKNKGIIISYLLLAFCFSSCLRNDEVTDTTQTGDQTKVLGSVPIVVYDTTHIKVVVYDTVYVSNTGKIVSKKDTLKVVVPDVKKKTFEELASDVRRVYRSQIGVYEKTGHNDGVQIKKYLASVGLPEGYAYCAAGVHWTLLQAGIQNNITGAAASTLNRSNLVMFNHKILQTPHFADVVSFWIPSLNGIHHCGFIDSIGNTGNIVTVEFNTSVNGESGVQREGGGVGRKVRSKNGTYAWSRWIK